MRLVDAHGGKPLKMPGLEALLAVKNVVKLQVLLLLLIVIAVAAVAGDIVLKNRAETELANEEN